MIRRLLTFISALSLALCLATLCLWIRGYFVSDRLWLFRCTNRDNWVTGTNYHVLAGRGGIGIEWNARSAPADGHYRRVAENPGPYFKYRDSHWIYDTSTPAYPQFSSPERDGSAFVGSSSLIYFTRGPEDLRFDHGRLVFPLVAFALPLAILPALWLCRRCNLRRELPHGRALFTAMSAISLLLCLATLTVGVRSYWTENCLTRQQIISPGVPPPVRVNTLTSTPLQPPSQLSQLSQLTLSLSQGAVRLNWLRTHSPSHYSAYIQFPRGFYPIALRGESFWGGLITFRFDHNFQPPPARSTAELRFPLWFPALCLAILPSLWLRRRLRLRKRLRLGLCHTCGYDLRATPSRCPECGQIPQHAASHKDTAITP